MFYKLALLKNNKVGSNGEKRVSEPSYQFFEIINGYVHVDIWYGFKFGTIIPITKYVKLQATH